MRRGWGLAAALVVGAGCGGSPSGQCVTMHPSPLLAQAKRLRLDLYASPPAHCDGGRAVTPGVPLATASFAPGDAVRLDVSPGHRVVQLTAFADAAQTQIIGMGCSEQDLAAGGFDCIDLAIGPPDGGVVDLAVHDSSTADLAARDSSTADLAARDSSTVDLAVPDLATPPDLASAADLASRDLAAPPDLASPDLAGCVCGNGICCNNVCTNVMSDPMHCGGCNNACSALNGTPGCTNGGCTWQCNMGFAHCQMGNTGCETALNSITNCGGCGNACDTQHSVGASCNGVSCQYTGCAVGYADCNMGGADVNGCECATPGCCGNLCQTKHDDGVGQNYFDCNALGTPGNGNTYNLMMAQEASTAWMGAGGAARNCTGQSCWRLNINGMCGTWCYTGALAGHVHVSAVCACPTVNDPTWN